MARKPFYIKKFDGGLVTNVSNDTLADNELAEMKNMDYDNRFALIRRLGYRDEYPKDENGDTLPNFVTDKEKGEQQQGYFKFTARPYTSATPGELSGLYNFDNQKEPIIGNLNEGTGIIEETPSYTAFISAVGGKLVIHNGDYLEERGIEGDFRNIFIPENEGWIKSLSGLGNFTIQNISNGNLNIRKTGEFEEEELVQDVDSSFSSVEAVSFGPSGSDNEVKNEKLIVESSPDVENYKNELQYIYRIEAQYELIKVGLPLSFGSGSYKVIAETASGGEVLLLQNSYIGIEQFNPVNLSIDEVFVSGEQVIGVRFEVSATNSSVEGTTTSRFFNITKTLRTIRRKYSYKRITYNRNIISTLTKENGNKIDLTLDIKSILTNTFTNNTKSYTLTDDNGRNITIRLTNNLRLTVDGDVIYNESVDFEKFNKYRVEIDLENSVINLFKNEETLESSSILFTEIKNPALSVSFGATSDTLSPKDGEYSLSRLKEFVEDIRFFEVVITGELSNQQIGEVIYPLEDLEIDEELKHTISSFQKGNVIEGIDLGSEFFITTGTKIIVLRFVQDGSGGNINLIAQELDKNAKGLTTQESLVGGLNLLSPNPFYIEDRTTDGNFFIELINFRKQIGVSNEGNIVKAVVALGSGENIEQFKFKWEAKRATGQEEDYEIIDVAGQDQDGFVVGDLGRDREIRIDEPAIYDIRVTMRRISDNVDSILVAYGYRVSNTDENLRVEPEEINKEINTCRRIIAYYGNIILYGNGTANIYKSYARQTNYFTTSGILPFNNLRQEPLNKLVQANNTLIGFTANSILALKGKGDDLSFPGREFEPFQGFINIERDIGCIAPQSVAKTNDGQVIFLSFKGLHVIETVNIESQIARAIKIDDKINNLIIRDKGAAGVVFNNKYYICFPNDNRIVKWHFVFKGIFSLDEGVELQYSSLYVYEDLDNKEDRLFAISKGDKLMRQNFIDNRTGEQLENLDLSNQGLFTDDGVIYEAYFETKRYGFEADEYIKKVFEFILGFNSVKDERIALFTDVTMDNSKIIDSVPKAEALDTVEEDDPEFEENTEYIKFSIEEDGRTENTFGQGTGQIGPDAGNGLILNQSILDALPQTFRVFDIRKTQEGYKVKVRIEHKQDTFLRVFSLGMQYEVYGVRNKQNITAIRNR